MERAKVDIACGQPDPRTSDAPTVTDEAHCDTEQARREGSIPPANQEYTAFTKMELRLIPRITDAVHVRTRSKIIEWIDVGVFHRHSVARCCVCGCYGTLGQLTLATFRYATPSTYALYPSYSELILLMPIWCSVH